jgi:hypothetical protein
MPALYRWDSINHARWYACQEPAMQRRPCAWWQHHMSCANYTQSMQARPCTGVRTQLRDAQSYKHPHPTNPPTLGHSRIPALNNDDAVCAGWTRCTYASALDDGSKRSPFFSGAKSNLHYSATIIRVKDSAHLLAILWDGHGRSTDTGSI